MARRVKASGAIQADGLQSLYKSLQAVGADKTEIAEANRAAAITLIEAALPRVPVLTGRLKASLKPGTEKGLQNAAVARAGNNGRLGYAAPIHWGWAVVGAKHRGKLTPTSNRRFRNIEPQPFFSEALGYTYEEIIRNYNYNMQKLVNKYGLGE
jgi:hypothetical protein